MPVAGDGVRGLGGGAEVDVGGADPDVGGSIELASLVDGEIGLGNDLGPGTGTGGGRRVGEALGIEVGENESLIESNFAGCRVRARHGRVGEGGVGGADLEILSGGDGGEQHE